MENCLKRMMEAGIPRERILRSEPMRLHTTFRIGGPADLFVSAASEGEILAVCEAARQTSTRLTVIGNGSNILVSDEGIRGVTLCIGKDMSAISVEGETVTAQAGALLIAAANKAMEAGLSGMEQISGIPGHVGGAICMNAGAYGGLVSDGLVSVSALDPQEGTCREYSAEEMAFGYRTSLAQTGGLIVTGAQWKLERGDRGAIKAAMDEYSRKRREKQPLQYPSAGSVFKRPEGYFAGQLIEEAGLKGLTVGGAQVSTLHAGFIINTGNATAADVVRLIDTIRARVYTLFGVELEPEVRRIGGNA